MANLEISGAEATTIINGIHLLLDEDNIGQREIPIDEAMELVCIALLLSKISKLAQDESEKNKQAIVRAAEDIANGRT